MNRLKFPKLMGRKIAFLHPEYSAYSFSQKEILKYFTFLMVLLISFFPKKGIAQCNFDSNNPIGCNAKLNITVDLTSCEFTVTPSLFSANYSSLPTMCQDSLHVHVENEAGDVIGTGSTVLINPATNPLININDSIIVTLFEDLNANNMIDSNEPNCWGKALIEDKTPPQILGCRDTTVYCTEDLANVAGGIVPITAMDNCSSSTVTLLDSVLALVTCATDPNIKATLVKRWIAADLYGNADTCTQTITILRLPVNTLTIEAPANVSLDCNSSNPPDISADALGYPIAIYDNFGTQDTFELSPQNTTGLCSDLKVLVPVMNVGPFPDCGNTENFLRTFEAFDCCADAVIATVSQTIMIIDTIAAILTCPSNLTVGTNSNSCTASVLLNPVGINDACGSSPFIVTTETPVGNINGNGGFINNVPLGTHEIKYIVEDACGNISECSISLTVNDDKSPVAVCIENTVVSVNNLGQASIPALSIDNGSHDNCGIVSYEVRRMASNCFPATPFASMVDFACCDINDTIMVELKVTDAAGNMNSCMVEVQVQDKIAPDIICPSNKIIECGQDTSVAAMGMAFGVDNCGTTTVTYTDSDDLDPTCGTGTITRFWTVTDAQGFTNSCVQFIQVVNTDPFSGNTDPNDVDDIIFPTNLMGANAISCTAYQSDPTLIDPINTGTPTIIGNTLGCSMVGTVQLPDLVLQIFGTGDCPERKIFRKWAIVDWCQAPSQPDLTQNGPGVWVHSQIIVILDDDAPILTNPPADFTEAVDGNCQAVINLPTIPQSAIQDCNTSSVIVSVTSNLGVDGFGPFTVGPGNYEAIYTLDDGCGNTTSHTLNVTVEDQKEPTPVCQGLSAPLMVLIPGSGMLSIDAEMFILPTTSDNCTDYDDLEFTIVFDSLNTNVPPTTTSLNITCDDVGLKTVAVWVCDEAGKCDYCTTVILVQDNTGTCPPPAAMAAMSGIIDNEMGEGIEEVEININNGTFMDMTDEEGVFDTNLPMHENYNIKPSKYNDHINGVTTYDIVKIQKHILGVELLDSPYKVIASDVNGSGNVTALDLLAIRNLILQNVDVFPNNMPSWRFVEANHVFQNLLDPFTEEFPEDVDIQNLEVDLANLNFVAIKLGDVTGNATPNLLAVDTRNTVGKVSFQTQNKFVKKGETVSLIFTTENESELAAWQYSLSFEKELVKFVDFENRSAVHFGTSLLEKGNITLAWDNDENVLLENKLTWFEIQFLAREDIEIKDAISITSKYTTAIAYNEKGDEYDVQLLFENQNTEPTDRGLMLYSNTPNPFTDATSINYYLPKKDFLEITVYDLTGKLLKVYTTFSEGGKQSFTIRKGEINSSGLLYYHLKTADHQVSGKMVLLP